MDVHLYFSLIPEALIASHLTPEEFGQYYATGRGFKSKGQSLFFEVDPSFRNDYFEIDAAIARCIPDADGGPKRSVYISVYRVLEHLPVSALGRLYLTTAYGHTLGLDRGAPPAESPSGLHLYQDIVPVNTLVVSSFEPHDFYDSVTSKPSKFIRFPGIFFVELELGDLAKDPENGQANDLPYSYLHHLREALMELGPGVKESKMVQRVHALDFPYRMVKKGFYVGNGPDFAFYPMPGHAELRDRYNHWWHTANL